ncbi:MAG: efflux RND transporter periplasmic adaptor subunit [Pseudomonadota bacterium]
MIVEGGCRWWNRFCRLAMISAALGAALGAEGANAQRGPAGVLVDPVTVIEVAETQPIIARLVAIEESVVATRIPGIVAEIFVRVGDRVENGDPLVRIDTELLEIELDGAEATLTQVRAGLKVAEANEDLAEQVMERTRQLEGSAAFSQGRADDLVQEHASKLAELARAEAALAVAEAQVETARYRRKNAVIGAPFSGVVLAREASTGDYLTAGGAVATVIDDTRLEIEADVPTEIVAALKPGDTVSTLMDDGAPGVAQVRAVVPSESPATRTRPVRFSIGETQSSKPLAAGQSVTVLAPVGPLREVVSVAKDALVQQVNGWIVFVAVDGKAVPRRISLGTAIDDRYEVSGEVSPGDLVVVRGNERLRPGQPIAFEDPGGAVTTGSAVAPAEQTQ